METPIRRKVTDSKKRFLWHMDYIKRTGKFCAPIVIVRTESNHFIILDGSHRMSALYALRLHQTLAVDAWIGSLAT
jgi:Uri superfamily endonuclease